MHDDTEEFLEESGQTTKRLCEWPECSEVAFYRIGKTRHCREHYARFREWMRIQGLSDQYLSVTLD